MNRKWLGVVVGVLLVGVLAFGAIGTGAWFSDVETATDNTFFAGTLDLVLNEGTPAGWGSTIGPLVPGAGFGVSIRLTNVGNTPGYLGVQNIVVAEGGGDYPEPEAVVEGLLGKPANEGNLASFLYAHHKWFIDPGCDGSHGGHYAGGHRDFVDIPSRMHQLASAYSLRRQPDTAATDPPIYTILGPGQSICISLNYGWNLPHPPCEGTPGCHNLAQGDIVNLGMEFILVQTEGQLP